jgi:hypothetical protein
MKKLILSFAFIAMSIVSYAQVGIGTTDPDATSALEIKSSTKGFLPPRLSITQANAIENPAEGLTFYCTDCDIKGLFFFNGDTFIGVVDGLGLSAVLDASNAVLAQIGTDATTNNGTSEVSETDLDDITEKANIIHAFFNYAQEKQKAEASFLIEEENLNEDAAKRYIVSSLKREYASENGTELNSILPKISPLNPQYLTKKQSVFQKIASFVETFKGVGGQI